MFLLVVYGLLIQYPVQILLVAAIALLGGTFVLGKICEKTWKPIPRTTRTLYVISVVILLLIAKIGFSARASYQQMVDAQNSDEVGDITVCDNMLPVTPASELNIPDCYAGIAMKTKDPSICAKIDGAVTERGRDRFSVSRAYCYQDVAREARDVTICDMGTFEPERCKQTVYLWLAIDTLDESWCDKARHPDDCREVVQTERKERAANVQ